MDLQTAGLPLLQMLTLVDPEQLPAEGQADPFSKRASLLRPTVDPSRRSSTSPSDASGAASKPTKTGRHKPVPFSAAQSKTLLSILRYADTLSSTEKELVGIVLGLSPVQVTRWFCNARARSLRRSKKYCDLEKHLGEGGGSGSEERREWGGSNSSGSGTDCPTDAPLHHIDPRLVLCPASSRPVGTSNHLAGAPHDDGGKRSAHAESATTTSSPLPLSALSMSASSSSVSPSASSSSLSVSPPSSSSLSSPSPSSPSPSSPSSSPSSSLPGTGISDSSMIHQADARGEKDAGPLFGRELLFDDWVMSESFGEENSLGGFFASSSASSFALPPPLPPQPQLQPALLDRSLSPSDSHDLFLSLSFLA